MSEKETRIAHIKEKLIGLQPNTPEHQYYTDLLLTLQPPVLKVHNTPEVCESCQ
jgi:hypothetical protein